MDLETRIETTRKRRYLNVDAHGDEVWVSMVVEAARCHVTLTKEQAKDMIAALIRIVDADKPKDIKETLQLAREALSYTATELTHDNFEAEEKALVAIDFALEKL